MLLSWQREWLKALSILFSLLPRESKRDCWPQHRAPRTRIPRKDWGDRRGCKYGAMTAGRDCYRFQSRIGTMAKIFPVASDNRKPSGSRPEWRLATSGARVFAAAIASPLVATTQISFSTGMAPLSQSIENTAGSFEELQTRRYKPASIIPNSDLTVPTLFGLYHYRRRVAGNPRGMPLLSCKHH